MKEVGAASGSSAATSSAAGGASASKKAKVHDGTLAKLTVAESRKYYPPGQCSMYWEAATNRVRAQFKDGAVITRNSAPADGEGGEHGACKEMLRWLWTLYTLAHSVDCPYPQLFD